MKTIRSITVLTLLVLVYSCSKDEPTKSNEAKLLKLEMEHKGTTYTASISGTSVTLSNILPYGTEEVSIKTLQISDKATANKKVGDKLNISDNPLSIEIIAENGTTKKRYSVSLEVAIPSTEANLLEISFSFNDNDYAATINNGQAVINEEFAYNAAGNISVKSFNVSKNATSNISIGKNFDIDNPLTITVTSQDKKTENTYNIKVLKDTDGKLMIEQGKIDCNTDAYQYKFGEFILENNLWNAGNLGAGTYSQCIYHYSDGNTLLFGWEWDFPDDAHGVNSYPEITFGHKPWSSTSTTSNLPKKISEVNKLIVNYEVEVHRDNGDYNLAFDNWIVSDTDVSPEKLRFEMMIWEESQNLVPGSEDYFQENVKTSNGIYAFYKGKTDAEGYGDPKVKWTYLAFKRLENRRTGQVDVKELLDYLVNTGVVSPNLYLATIEFGNELGNSKGYTVIKQFDIAID